MMDSVDMTDDVIGVPPTDPQKVDSFWAEAMGFNTVRHWCTAVAVADSGGGMTLLIAKEVVNMRLPDGSQPQISRNVASLIMPATAAIGLRDALMTTYPPSTDGQANG